MSRIGNRVLTVPEDVTVSVNDGQITVKGPKGELSLVQDSNISVNVEGNEVKVTRNSEIKKVKQMHGTTNALIANRHGRNDSGCVPQGLQKIHHRTGRQDSSAVKIDLTSCDFTAACDVEAVFTGPEGAARVFAAQKGADEKMISELEAGMKAYESVIRECYGINLSEVKGSGAAGGLGGCLHTFFNASMKKGSELILEITGFDFLVKDADLVITGEGKIDSQTFMGKIPSEIALRALSHGVETIAVGALVESDISASHNTVFKDILAIQPRPTSEKELSAAMNPETTKENIRRTISTYFAENH